jgi:hypothetical protein
MLRGLGHYFDLELFSFILTALLAGLLIQIRLTQRPKFIRDLVKHFITPNRIN